MGRDVCTGFPGLGAEFSFFSEWCSPYDNLLIHTLDLYVSGFVLFLKEKKKENYLLEEREKVDTERKRSHTDLDKSQVLPPISSVTVGE